MHAAYRLEIFDSNTLPPGRVVAELHSRLLPTSPAVKLGTAFLEEFFYRILVQLGSVQGAVAWIGDTPAGFIVTTDDSAQFMGKALKARFPQAATAGVVSLLQRPTRIAAVFEIVRLMKAYESQLPDEPEGEILSMGVDEDFRDPGFIAETGHNIAIDLLELELERMRGRGLQRVRAVVDSDNVAAKFFYRGCGWKLERTAVPGWHNPTVEFLFDLEEERR